MSKGGRPTDYDPKYIEEIIEFFKSWPEYREVERETASAGRVVKYKEKLVNYPPTLNKFAIKLGIDRHTLRRWAEANPEFCNAYNACKTIQEEWLSDRGSSGEYNPGFTKLMLVNHTDIKDKVTHEVDDDTKKALKLAYAIRD